MSDIAPTFTGEVQLAGWSDSHSGGAKIVLWLPDRDQLDVFAGLTARKGNTAGHRFMCVLVEIGDDEQPVQPLETPQSPKGGPLAKLAGLWCNEESFWEWLRATHHDVWSNYDPPGEPDRGLVNIAADCVRHLCNVTSRAEIDTKTEARVLFDNLIRMPYAEYRARQQEKP